MTSHKPQPCCWHHDSSDVDHNLDNVDDSRQGPSTLANSNRQQWGKAVAVLVIAVLWIARPSVAGAATTGAEGIDAIGAYAGTWRTQIITLKTPYSTARKEASTLTNDCWHSHEFFACQQLVNGESKAFIVFAYNAKDKSYSSYPIAPGADSVHRSNLVIAGNVWTYPWQEVERGKTMHFRVVNVFTSPGTIQFRKEYSADEKHWTLMATGQEHRVR